MNPSFKPRKIFSRPLRFVSLLTWLNNIAAIPYSLINAWLISEIISTAIKGEVGRVFEISAFMICFVILYKLILSGLTLLISLKDMKSTQSCKMILYNKILTSPLSLLFSSTNGDVLENLTDDFAAVTSVYKSLYPGFITAFLTAIIYLIYIGTKSIFICAALILLSLLQLAPPVIIRKYMQVNYNINREAEAKITDFTVAGYNGMGTIKLFSLNKWYLDKLKQIHSEAQHAGRKAELTGAVQSSMESFVSNLLKYGMYIIIGIIVFASKATLDVGVQAIALSGGLFGAIKSIFGCIPSFSLVRKSEERLSKWFLENRFAKMNLKKSDYALCLENISYQYDSDMILNDLNLKIKNNEIVLLKGENGAGKTTLARIIAGLLEAQKGTVTFGNDENNDKNNDDKNDDNNGTEEFWGDVLFYLPQEDIKFDITASELCEMLKCKPDISDFEEWGLSKAIIESTNISDLSGGERKKVYLTIAFVSNPKILILDEPSNSLDTEAREVLCRRLRERLKATLVITHDGYLYGLASETYKLENGRVKNEKHS